MAFEKELARQYTFGEIGQDNQVLLSVTNKTMLSDYWIDFFLFGNVQLSRHSSQTASLHQLYNSTSRNESETRRIVLSHYSCNSSEQIHRLNLLKSCKKGKATYFNVLVTYRWTFFFVRVSSMWKYVAIVLYIICHNYSNAE